MFTLAREGLLPRYFAAVDQRTETPKRAVAALAIMTLAGIILLATVKAATLVVGGYIATAAALMYVVAYIVAMLALGVYGIRELRNWLLLMAAVAGSVAFGYALYRSVYPAPYYPLSVWTWAGVSVGCASCTVAVLLRASGARVARSFGQSVSIDTAWVNMDEASGEASGQPGQMAQPLPDHRAAGDIGR
jgi:amino acid transporter